MTDAPWTADFEIAGRLVRVRKTGAEVPLDRDAIKQLLTERLVV